MTLHTAMWSLTRGRITRTAEGSISLIRRRPIVFALIVCVAIVEYLAIIRGAPTPTSVIFTNPFASIAFATLFYRYLWHDTSGKLRENIILMTPLPFIIALVSPARHNPALLVLTTLALFGMLGAIGFILAALNASQTDRAKHIEEFADASIIPLAGSLVLFGLSSTYTVNPVYDGRIYAFEEILGIRFSLIGVRSYQLLNPFSTIATLCYNTIAPALVVVAAEHRRRGIAADVLTASVVVGACGVPLYFACPVVGPLHAFGPAYPGSLPVAEPFGALIVAPLDLPRNGMPSLHVVWALLIWFNANALPEKWRWSLKLFVVLTLWAVMGLEDTHWMMDVVVAVPMAVAIQTAVITRRVITARRCWTRVAVCAAITAIWIIGFTRAQALLFSLPRTAAWIAVLFTVWWPLNQQRAARLDPRDRLIGEQGSSRVQVTTT